MFLSLSLRLKVLRSHKKQQVGFIPYGGLGNQLFQYATALSLQIEEDRDLAIDLIGRARNNLEELPEIMDFQIEKISHISIRRKSDSGLLNLLIELQLRISNIGIKNSTLDILFSYFQRLFSQVTSVIVGTRVLSPRGLGWDDKLKASKKSFTLLGNFHSYLFINERVRTELRNKLKSRNKSELIESFARKAIDERPVAIHIRLGDYLSIDELNVVNKEYFANAVMMMESDRPGSNYWVFTNDESLARQYLPSHLSSKLTVIPQSFSSAQTLEVMWLCDRYIISNSTFSWWGAYLSKASDPLVIAPKRWFKTMDEPKFVCPNGWIRL